MPTLATAPPPVTGLMTADEFWEFSHRPENEHRNLDLIRGVVVEMSRPKPPHGETQANISFEFVLWKRTTGATGYICGGDAGVILDTDPDTVVGPDVAYYAATTVPRDWGDVAPVVAVEILSPNDRPGQVEQKVREYFDAGTAAVWLVDTNTRTVAVLRAGQPAQLFRGEDRLEGGTELPGFSVPVSQLFPPAAP